MSLAPPPAGLSDADLARLTLESLPAPEGWEAVTVWRFADTGEFVTNDEEEAAQIRAAFPSAKIIQL